jgi:hypothetical protein
VTVVVQAQLEEVPTPGRIVGFGCLLILLELTVQDVELVQGQGFEGEPGFVGKRNMSKVVDEIAHIGISVELRDRGQR